MKNLLATVLTGARFLACCSQHHSTLDYFLLSQLRRSFLPSEPKVKQVSKHFTERKEVNRGERKKREKSTAKENRSYQKKIEQNQKKVEQKLYNKGLETLALFKSDKEKKKLSS